MSNNEKVVWVMDTLGVDAKEAREIVAAMDKYTIDGYGGIHSGANKELEAKIDKLLKSKKFPVYKGETFRGLTLEAKDGKTGEQIFRDILKTGTWHEPGITSFSSRRGVAEGFMGVLAPDSQDLPILLRNTRNRSGVPVQHLSGAKGEFEVLMPSSIRNRGFRITGYKKIPFDSYFHKNGHAYLVDIAEN